MICESCKQRPATISVTQTQNGQQVTHHYCDVCSGNIDKFHMTLDDDPTSIQKLFSDWFGVPSWSTDAPKRKQEESCKQCGLTYNDFLQQGKFNCPTCYETFKAELPMLLRKLHNGATEHNGKVPSSYDETYSTKRQIEEIRAEMKIAIEEERFEDAATLRDRARVLEAKLGGE